MSRHAKSLLSSFKVLPKAGRKSPLYVSHKLLHIAMNTRNPYQFTPEDLALAQARREKKLKHALEAEALQASSKLNDTLLSRPWITVSQPQASTTSEARSDNVKILTWNLLAQCLVRRELFPTSDCLKIAQRLPLIHEEIRRQDAQIICLQEVDNLEKLLPMLEKAGYAHHYASGPRKKHGCLIAYKKDLYSFVSDNTVYYDDQPVGTIGGPDRIGASFKTKNIGYMVALKSKANETEGIIVATTHLFWHPRYTYERIRQTAILVRETAAFRELHLAKKWPCVIAGDFNFGPNDPAYSLTTGDTLLSSQKDLIPPSMVVHSSLDPTILKSIPSPSKTGDEDEGDTVDPDRHITNARAPVEADGLLSVPEIIKWFSALPRLKSIYADGLREARKLGNNIPSYGSRTSLLHGRNGAEEPEYTSYTHYWQAVLDYIFILEPSEGSVHINGLLNPLTEKDMTPGLPQKHISGSDHTCLVAELTW